jgi:hypothetical protein
MKHNYSFKFLLVLIIGFSENVFFAQHSTLYTPLNVLEAYKNKTRSWDGKPGSQYWQNYSDYDINVKVNTDSKTLTGSETITYHNNSPDTLHKIVIRLYQDIFKAGGSRDFSVPKSALADRVKINSLLINDEELTSLEGMIQRSETNLSVYLPKHLVPKSEVKIYVEWSFEIPFVSPIRMGAYKSGLYYLAYWYPQIAVYDDIDGWDINEYYGRAEFYNDFNNYSFKIEVPAKYVVWATGELQNAEEVFNEKIVKRIEDVKQSSEIVKIISENDYNGNEVTKINSKNIWKFKADKVPDVTFALSDNYVWDAGSVIVDSATGRRTMVSAVYPDTVEQYNDVVQYSMETILYLSNELPGVPYPYPHVTTVCNGRASGGMESPMMANNGAPISKSSMVGLVFHEISHNYFPFFMGVNERKYGWMDEGWAAFLPKEIVNRNVADYDYMAERAETYIYGAGTEADPPPIIPTYAIVRSPEFRNATYSRPAVAYNLLKEYLGKEKFRAALQVFIKRWNGKHPLPNDFFITINNVVSEDLYWFWKPWFFESGFPDLEITDAEQNGSNKKIVIKKNGKLPIPIFVKVVFEDNSEKTFNESMAVWKSGNEEFILIFDADKRIKSIELGKKIIPDAIEENNKFDF